MSASRHDTDDSGDSEIEMDSVLASVHHRQSIQSLRQALLRNHVTRDRLTPLTPFSDTEKDHIDVLPRTRSSEGIPIHESYRSSYSSLADAGSPLNANSPSATRSNSVSPALSPRASYLQFRLTKLLNDDVEIRNDYGLDELRDGFFDAVYVRSTKLQTQIKDEVLSEEDHPTTASSLPSSALLNIGSGNTTVRMLLKLSKAFLAYFIAFILCLVNVTSSWLFKHCYFMPFAALFHHPARSVGSQIEITILSLAGEAFGLGWSSLALYLSSATPASRHGYAGIHAASLILALLWAAYVQATWVRFHHFVLSFVFAIIFMETVQVSEVVPWHKAWNYGIPYMFGVLVCLVVNILFFPDSGHTAITLSLSTCLENVRVAVEGLVSNDVAKRDESRREISIKSLQLTESFREFCNEVSLTTASNKDLVELRNCIQVSIGRVRAVPSPSSLFMPAGAEGPSIMRTFLAEPARNCIITMAQSYDACSKFVDYLRRGSSFNYDLKSLELARRDLEAAVDLLSEGYKSMSSQSVLSQALHQQEVLDIFLYLYYIDEAARKTLDMVKTFEQVSQKGRKWRICWPTYPWRRALRRTTAQITHDRGGQTAAYFYQAKRDVDDVFRTINTSTTSRKGESAHCINKPLLQEDEGGLHKFWAFIHALQDFEARFALKAAVAVTLVALPAWMTSSRTWYGENCAWFSVYTAYIGFHPRVAGNLNDVGIRTIAIVSGSVWAGIAMRARYGNPYVLSVFCAIFMIPAFYRFIGTVHPRSGLLACVSFTLVSLSMYFPPNGYSGSKINFFTGTWTRLAALEVGMTVTVLINWVFWPFVARREVRHSLSTLLNHISQSYLIVTDRYLYRDMDDAPTEQTLQLGEIREQRMLQSMHALRELLNNTKHEVRLRNNFNREIYEHVLDYCGILFQKISEARISSMHFNVSETGEMYVKLLSLRRDAVASVIFVLNILAGAYKTKTRIPKYLPSAALSRKLLFDTINGALHEQHGFDPPSLQMVAEKEIVSEKRTSPDQSERSSRRGQKKHVKIVLSPSVEEEEEDSSVEGDDEMEDDEDDQGLTLGPARGLQRAAALEKAEVSSELDKAELWRIVHETAFSRSFTEITEELERLIAYSKALFGEDGHEKRHYL